MKMEKKCRIFFANDDEIMKATKRWKISWKTNHIKWTFIGLNTQSSQTSVILKGKNIFVLTILNVVLKIFPAIDKEELSDLLKI